MLAITSGNYMSVHDPYQIIIPIDALLTFFWECDYSSKNNQQIEAHGIAYLHNHIKTITPIAWELYL